MKMNRRKKATASAAFVALAATAVIGGTLAQFTDRDTTADQTLQAGTVNVSLTEGADWDTSNLLLAVDDTLARSVTVTNEGNLAIKAVKLSADVADTKAGIGAANLADGVTVTVTQEGNATPLAEDVLVSDLQDYNLVLGAGGLAPAADTDLTFEYKVVASPDANGDFTDGDYTSGDRTDFATNPDNRFQDAAFSVTYTVDAIQRDAIAQ